MTENKIIKALECCGSPYNRCLECPLCEMERVKCFTELTANALNLINRQKAETGGLSKAETFDKNITKLLDMYEVSIKSEAVKEFAERLHDLIHFDWDKIHKQIDNLVKEMVGE